MDFGKILDDWDSYQKKERKTQKVSEAQQESKAQQENKKSSQKPSSPQNTALKHHPSPGTSPNDYLNHWLVLHGTQDKDSSGLESDDDRLARIQNAQRLRNLAPQATIDLHGKTAAEAEADLGRFLAVCSREGLEKVLIIHGKGNHSENEGIMTDLVRRVLENSDLAARFGFEDRQHGGRGATWVILRKRDYFSR
ncbi:MAG TPA: Smr/MutS family protein [Spirochaetales bacterium]|nr:Smr/MutS family protein [Spirochaetales bacterium]